MSNDFSPDYLIDFLRGHPAPRYWIAFSGGLDSTVLLHSLASIQDKLSTPVEAIHVDHGWSEQSVTWSQQCALQAETVAIPCSVVKVDARPQAGESPEAVARHARYGAFASLMAEGDVLLTAHHQGDQGETLLLQLFRGAGPKGLSAMPASAPFASGSLLRPLLGFTQASLRAYAEHHGLSWIDDPSNFDTGYDRNYLRHEVMPVLEERWPSLMPVLSRSASHFAEAAHLLDVLAAQDLALAKGLQPESLSIDYLRQMEMARAHNLIRYWLRQQSLPLPDTTRLERIVSEVVNAREDAMPLVHWSGCEVRRYRDGLFAMLPLEAIPADYSVEWDMQQPLILPGKLGRLEAVSCEGEGLKAGLCEQKPLLVKFRTGGERCQPKGRQHSHSLKNLLQEQGISPWQRERVPLLTFAGQLAHVAGLWDCEPFTAMADEAGIIVKWHR